MADLSHLSDEDLAALMAHDPLAQNTVASSEAPPGIAQMPDETLASLLEETELVGAQIEEESQPWYSVIWDNPITRFLSLERYQKPFVRQQGERGLMELAGDFTTLSLQEAFPGPIHAMAGLGGLATEVTGQQVQEGMGGQGTGDLEQSLIGNVFYDPESKQSLDTYNRLFDDLTTTEVELAYKIAEKLGRGDDQQFIEDTIGTLGVGNAVLNLFSPSRMAELLVSGGFMPVKLALAVGIGGGVWGWRTATKPGSVIRTALENAAKIGRVSPDVNTRAVESAFNNLVGDLGQKAPAEMTPEELAKIRSLTDGAWIENGVRYDFSGVASHGRFTLEPNEYVTWMTPDEYLGLAKGTKPAMTMEQAQKLLDEAAEQGLNPPSLQVKDAEGANVVGADGRRRMQALGMVHGTDQVFPIRVRVGGEGGAHIAAVTTARANRALGNDSLTVVPDRVFWDDDNFLYGPMDNEIKEYMLAIRMWDEGHPMYRNTYTRENLEARLLDAQRRKGWRRMHNPGEQAKLLGLTTPTPREARRPLILFADSDSADPEYMALVQRWSERADAEEAAVRSMMDTAPPRDNVGIGTQIWEWMDRKARMFLHARHMAHMESEELGRIIMRQVPDEATRRDMIALMQATGTYEYVAEGLARGENIIDDIANVHRRLRKQYSPEEYNKIIQLAEQIGARRKLLFAELNTWRGRVGEDEIDPVSGWLHQNWKLPRKPSAAQQQFLEQLDSPRLAKMMIEEPQKLPSYFRGMAVGLEPRSRDIADILFMIDNQMNELVARKKLIASLANFSETKDGLPVFVRGKAEHDRVLAELPEGTEYLKFNLEFADKILPEALDEAKERAVKAAVEKYGAGIPDDELRRIVAKAVKDGEYDQVWIHKEAWEPLRRVIQPKSLWKGKVNPTAFEEIAKWYWNLAMFEKRAVFGLTAFHMMPLTENVVAMGGPIRGLQSAAAAVRGGAGMPIPYEWAKAVDDRMGGTSALNAMIEDMRAGGRGQYTEQLRNALFQGSPLEEAFHLTSYFGLKVGPPRADLVTREIDEMARAGVHWAAKHAEKGGAAGRKLGHAAEKMTEVVQGWQRMWDAGLWDRFHTPLKVAWADMLLHQMLGAKYGYTEGLPALDKLMGRMGLTKKLGEYTDEQIARSVMSFVNDEMGGQNWALHTKNSFMRAISDERVLEIMSSQFLSPDWNTSAIRVATAAADFKDPVRQALGVKHWVYSGMSWYLLANSINYMMTGHHMWDNAPGRRLHHIELPFKSAEGKQLYINIYKQFREGPEFALNALRFIQRKQRGLVRLAQSGEEDSSGFKTRVGEYIAQQFKEGRETVEPMEYGFFLLDALEQFIPFMLRGTARGAGHGETFPQKAVLALLSQWFPVSTGLNMRDGEVLLAEAMRDGDTDQIMTVVVSLQANGYPTSEIRKTLSRARNKARKYQ